MRRNGEETVRGTKFIITEGVDRKFNALKVPRQCPRVLLVNMGWKQGKALGSAKGSKLEVDHWEHAAGEKT
jgi:hypothetical protein